MRGLQHQHMVRGECRRGANKESEERAPPNIRIVQFILTHPFIFTLFIFWIYGLHSGVSALAGRENSDIE